MLLTAKIKLLCDDNAYSSLKKTLQRVNAACNRISEIAFANKVFNRHTLQKLCYYQMREESSLGSQIIIRAIAKVTASYADKGNRNKIHKFGTKGAVGYDLRLLSFDLESKTVSIWSEDGRIKNLRFAAGPRQLALLNGTRRESKLCLSKNNGFYLAVSCEVADDPMLQDPSGILGVDMGIDNIAVDSEGHFYDSGNVKQVRSRYARLRADLQSKGTRSSHRKLRRVSNSESRFVHSVNHEISKRIVTKAKDTGRYIGLEDLHNIRQAPANKSHRKNLNSWGFYDLRTKIEYKALRAGILVMVVLPSFTSQRCSSCGFTDKRNRKGGAFCCIDCGHTEHADVNAAKNIAFRANVNRPNVYKSPSGPGKPTTLVVGS